MAGNPPMSEQPKRICILGGGFGGLYTALRLSQFPWEPAAKPEIILADKHDRFLFSPLLYELITGELETWEISPPFAELLANTGVRFRQSSAKSIDLGTKQVELQDGSEILFDRLVLAVGGETPLDMVRGCEEHAIPFRTIADAYRLQEQLQFLETSDKDKIRVVVVGGGYSGVELACKIADRLQHRGRIRIIEQGNTILGTSAEFNREAARKALTERGIWIDLETTVAQIDPDTISLIYKEQTDIIPVDLVLWTVGNRVSPLIRQLPLKQNQRGQLLVTSTLQIPDYPDIFALGDLADCSDAGGQKIPATAQAAMQQADYAAWNIWASLTHRPLLSFRYLSLGEMMTLGTENATLSGLGLTMDGSLAAVIRRLVYLYRLPTLEHQLKVGFNWITRPIRDMLVPRL